MDWLAPIVMVVWVAGIPVARGVEKNHTISPDAKGYLFWPVWYGLYLVIKALILTWQALRWSWLALEDMGTSWGRR